MAIAFVTAGTVASGTTSVAVPYPTGIVAGNMLILAISYKYGSTSIPTAATTWAYYNGFGQTGVGTGTGIDIGEAAAYMFMKIATGTETGSETVTLTGGNSIIARIFQYSKSAGNNWVPNSGNLFITGFDDTPSATISITTMTNVPTSIVGGDMIVSTAGINTDAYTYSAQVLTVPGATMGTMTERQDSGTTSGQDCALMVCDHVVTSGTMTGTISFSMTSSGTATGNPVVAYLAVVLREVLNTTVPPKTLGLLGIG